MREMILCGAIASAFSALAWTLFCLFEPCDPGSRRESVRVIREMRRSLVNMVRLPASEQGFFPLSGYYPESWRIVVEVDDLVLEGEVCPRLFRTVSPGVAVRVTYSKTRFTKRTILEEIRLE